MSHEYIAKVRKTIANAAEGRMRQWAMELQREQESRNNVGAGESAPRRAVRPYIALSRDEGTDTPGLAKLLGERLGWPTLDRSLLDYMADHYGTRRELLEAVDERAANWMEEVFGTWFEGPQVSQPEYIAKLKRFVWMAAKSESQVFVGRGCHLILPSDCGVSLFVTAPKSMRVEHVARTHSCSGSEAAKHVKQVDKRRREFYRRYFRENMGDIINHDFAVNIRSTTIDEVAELVCGHVRRRFPECTPKVDGGSYAGELHREHFP